MHVRAAVAVTLAGRWEDELVAKHPLHRFRRAVRQVIRLSREVRHKQARLARKRNKPGQQPLGDTMVRDLSRQVNNTHQRPPPCLPSASGLALRLVLGPGQGLGAEPSACLPASCDGCCRCSG